MIVIGFYFLKNVHLLHIGLVRVHENYTFAEVFTNEYDK